MRVAFTCLALSVSVLLLPLEVFAQMGALTGTVRDSSDRGISTYTDPSSFASVYDQTLDYAPTPENPQGWMLPTTIVQPRFVRLNVTVNF
jgi:hypothetical protein